MKLQIVAALLSTVSQYQTFEAHAFVSSPVLSRSSNHHKCSFSIVSQKVSEKSYRSVSLFLEPLAQEGDWSAYVDEGSTEDIYYFNEVTGESRWDPPTKPFPRVEETIDNNHSIDIDVPSKKKVLAREGSWAAYVDEEVSGMIYYFNTKTGESVWEPPTSTFPKIKMSKKEKDKMMAKRRAYAETLRATEEVPTQAEGSFLTSFMQSFTSPPKQSTDQQKDESVTAAAAAETKKPTKKEEKETITEPIDDSSEIETKEGPGLFNFFGKSDVEKDGDKGPMFGLNLFAGKEANTNLSVENEIEEEQKVEPTLSKISSSEPKVTKTLKEEPEIDTQTEPDFEEDERPSVVSNFMNLFKSPQTELSEEVDQIEQDEELEPEEFEPVFRPVKLEIAAKVLAHPEKVSWGGEDALFTAGRNFGVFDGVSGAEKEDGVPLYSVTLAQQMRQKVGRNAVDIEEITEKMLEAAEYADVSATGASTGLVASIGEDSFLRVLNVGDCTLVVIRDNQIVSRSKEISHFFDCPYQLSIDSPDRPIDGTILQVEVIPGDIIVAGSDGVFDNINDELLIETINGGTVKAPIICKNIVNTARKISLDPVAPTPYARLASRKGYTDFRNGLGGKLDDISCIVAKVK